MKKFEIGKRYYESGVTYEIIKKTAKTVTYKAIQHAGKSNERVLEQKTAKLQRKIKTKPRKGVRERTQQQIFPTLRNLGTERRKTA